LESTFWIDPNHAAPHWTVVLADCSLTYSYWGGKAIAPGCDGVFHALDTDLGRWRAAARTLLDGPFSLETMNAAIDRYLAVIGDAARSDPTPTTYSTFDAAVSDIRRNLPAIRGRLEELISPEPGGRLFREFNRAADLAALAGLTCVVNHRSPRRSSPFLTVVSDELFWE
jgi:hypothetical protein